MSTKPLLYDQGHADACHRRWMELRNRRQELPSYKDEWWAEQCGICRFFIPLLGTLGADYGACSNPTSPFDGMVRFEHDGCEEFSDNGEWVTGQTYETDSEPENGGSGQR